MSTLSKTAFEAQYVDNTTGTFADNTSQAISAGDMRQFADDIADSFAVSSGLNWTVVQIGDWNMDTTYSVNVSTGLTDYSKIRSVTVLIRDDFEEPYGLQGAFNSSGDLGGSFEVNSTGNTITLTRVTGGYFDSAGFDSTSFNRGWVTIAYTI